MPTDTDKPITPSFATISSQLDTLLTALRTHRAGDPPQAMCALLSSAIACVNAATALLRAVSIACAAPRLDAHALEDEADRNLLPLEAEKRWAALPLAVRKEFREREERENRAMRGQQQAQTLGQPAPSPPPSYTAQTCRKCGVAHQGNMRWCKRLELCWSCMTRTKRQEKGGV